MARPCVLTESRRSWKAERSSRISCLSDWIAVGGATMERFEGGAMGADWFAWEDEDHGTGLGKVLRSPLVPPHPCLSCGRMLGVLAIRSGAAAKSLCWAARSVPPGIGISLLIEMLLPAASNGPNSRSLSSARKRESVQCSPRSRMVVVVRQLLGPALSLGTGG